ncbi:non-ribosomal peptide synthetase [uncultured Methanobrevibacter sp.]|uniref:non-ribosomal peptide synthetase n=1 Tax=uncultured Methanobrevibacter sp. TaxID=253161 RepID=UPI0025EA286C|nr:non-ribosomal peptide synthetase [uncultured Methanobrevibacter sp.]
MIDRNVNYNKYFLRIIKGFDESTILNPDLNGVEKPKLNKNELKIKKDSVEEFCKENSISENILFLASTALTLNKFNFSYKNLIFHKNNIIFTTNFEKREISIKNYLMQIQNDYEENLKYSKFSIDKIIDEYDFQTEFYYAFNKDLNPNSLKYKYNFYLDIQKNDNEFILSSTYNDQLYSDIYVNQFLKSINTIIKQFLSTDITKSTLADISLVEEKESIEFEEVKIPFIHKRFEKQVEENPQNIALVADDATLTADELNKKANRIANALIKKGVKPKNNVLVMLHRNSDLIASILGILKAGCAYIPIDLEYPQDRINYIYENSQADYIISDANDHNSLNVKELLEEANESNPDVEITSDDLAYMIYTSGSTGNPKGVMISHENICNQVQNPKSEYKSLLCLATVSFDVSVDDILTSLSNGLKLILASDTQIKNIPELIELIDREKPEVSEITPSRLASYLEVPEFCDVIECLKCVFLGGEQFSTKVYENFKKYSNAIIYNSYGPTETTITSNNKEVTSSDDITVGLPLHNYVTDVRDIDGKLLPQGIMGELYIGGTGVGKGYYNMPDKTEEAFLTINDIPYYRSGDYAIEKPNGEIDIQGRIDNQIKLRGLRIEIGEIESSINKYPAVKQTVVVIKEINNNDHLCAYYTADEEVDASELKEFLKDKLTKYMIPTAYMQLDEMPQTPNGKTDIKALPQPKLDLENIKAENETEEKLFEIAAELINTDQFGVTDELYSIGFTSLILMKFNSLIYAEMRVNLDISILFNDPTIKKLASEIESSNKNSDLAEIIELTNSMDYLPLTDNQIGVYYECIQNPGEIKYTMPTTMRMGSDVDAEKLREAIIKTVEAHPYLKTRIVMNDKGELKQKRCDNIAIDNIEIVEVNSITDQEMLENDVKAYSFDNEQLFRIKIYKTPDETVLFTDFHHIITDGVSQINFFDDIANIYEGNEINEEIVDGYAYSLIEDNLKNSDAYEKAKEFFDEKLSQEIESTVLTPNLKGNPDEGKLKTAFKTIDTKEIKEFCNRYSINQNTLFLSGLVLTLNKYTFSNKALITSIFNGRSNSYYYNTQGFLVKTLPLIFSNENRQITIKEFIKSVDEVWKDTMTNSIYPYTKIAEEYHLKPEFFYTYQDFIDSDSRTINGTLYEENELESDKLNETEYKINFDIDVSEDKVEFIIQYNDELYTQDYIETFMESMAHVLNQFIENDINELMICDVELETTKELPTFIPLDNPFVHKRFETQVESKPDDIALVSNDMEYSYRELNELSNRIANGLINRGVKPRHNILIMLPRTKELIASIIGVLKAGCGFIPIDMEYPKERIEYIYENSRADYIIANETQENTLDIKELLEENNIENPDVEISPDDTAYMIYTSGSTGKPKGVMIGHENACNETESNPKCEYDNLLSIATIAFDTSLEDILTGLTNGIKIIFANDSEIKNVVDLISLIKKEKPQVMEFTPSRLLSYLEVDEFCEVIGCAECIVMGGEQFSAKAFDGVKEYTDAKVYNSYGPTEATIASNYKEITDPNAITIGKALQNYVTEVRDIDGQLLPKGVMGELYIGGTGVGKGYYNMPDKTKEVYLTINNIPYYRSGDYAIELPDGDIDIKGRIDNQIKLRGLRIEIGEIESNITRFPNIKNTVVAIKKINNSDHLCAYFTAETDIDINLLKRYLQSKLTKYMVPTVFMQIDEIPQTPNGKTDMKALPDPSLALDFVEPETKTEKLIFRLVSSLSSAEEFGITDDLYSLGFTSLTLMKLNSMIYNETDVNIEITDLFNNPTIQNLADKVDNNINVQIDISEFIKTAESMDLFPLTSNQLGIYYECAQTDEIKYTMPSAIRFASSVDPLKLKQAIIDCIEAHPYLKTRIITTPEGELRQKRCDDAEIDDIEIIEVDSITNREMMDKDIQYIPLDNNQLFRFKIYKTPEETVLFSDIHHIITDGVSMDLLFEDILSLYNGGEINEEIVDGYAYSLIEQELSENEVSKEYYKNRFSQGFESTVLTPNLNGNPDEADIKLIDEIVDSSFVRLFCKDHSLSPNVLFMSATVLALNKFTFSDKTLITTIFNGRSNSNYFNTQGMLVKTLPIMIGSENRNMMVEDFIKIVDKSWKDALVHSNYPYTTLSEEYQLKPEFFYAYHGAFETDNLEIDGNTYAMEELDGTVATDYKINMDVYDDGDMISMLIEYNDQIYTEEYVTDFLKAIKYILVQFFVNDMDKLRINEIELAPNFLLPEFEELDNPFLHKRFEVQVAEKPDEIALVASDETLTYKELDEKANRIANALIGKGVKPRSNILIMLPRNSDLIASIIGVLKAGCAFIPLDLKFPKERIEYIYENSQADYIINMDGLVLNSLSIKELLEENNITAPNMDISPDDLAYMIYTSGSTGNPKGVMISHENVCNQVEANPKCQYNNLLSIATVAFDTALEDILTGITNGIKIIFADDDEIKSIVELVRLIKREQPEVMEFTPSRLRSYLEFEEFCDAIGCAKCIVMGGEQFSAKAFNGVKKYCDAAVYNSYGPTEATIASNYKEITDPENITIGKALKNYVTEVRDIDGKLLPKGVMGELYIGGTGVGKGYYNMPDKTREVYLTIDDIPYYKSGDYAITLPDGDIDIKGRIDNQIKLRGLRIEIGEIESNISNFLNIKQNVVVIKEIRNNEHLCAYYTAEDNIDKDELKAYLNERLTQYMVPTVFMQIDEMPQTPNGKTDVKALPEPKLELTYVAPKNKVEHTICAIYSSILDIEIVGAEDNFFEIGGTSLIASKLIIELLKQDYDVKYDDIFKNQTPRKLASFLSGDEIDDDLDVDIIENYDYTKINNLLEKNTFENFAQGSNTELGNVLLTGVTGFLGAHVLYEYIKNEEGTIYCMLRKGKFNTCEERFIDLMNYYFDEDFTDLIGSRIILSEGDITNLDDFKKLDDYPIDTIINCAAIVKHYTHDDYIFRVNVDGVINGLEFAEANNITYIQISTTSVLDEYTEDSDLSIDHCDERTFYWGQDLSNKYLNSKFLAERMVLEKALNGLNVKIIRVGNLMARQSDGMFQKNYETNAFLNGIKAIKNLKATIPEISEEVVELSPIDYVAKATLELAKAPKECTVFHAVTDKWIPTSDIIDVLNSFGFGIKDVTHEEFREIYKQNMDENIQGIITADLTIDDFAEDDVESEYVESDDGELVVMDQTIEILKTFGFTWPECDKDYLTKFIKHLIALKYFD